MNKNEFIKKPLNAVQRAKQSYLYCEMRPQSSGTRQFHLVVKCKTYMLKTRRVHVSAMKWVACIA